MYERMDLIISDFFGLNSTVWLKYNCWDQFPFLFMVIKATFEPGRFLSCEGGVLQNLFGKWSEALYVGKAPSARCIWRPGALPDDAQLYFGFSRYVFAVKSNFTSHFE